MIYERSLPDRGLKIAHLILSEKELLNKAGRLHDRSISDGIFDKSFFGADCPENAYSLRRNNNV
jgi:hypothetical protein